jgi:signal transduction histidine kinase
VARAKTQGGRGRAQRCPGTDGTLSPGIAALCHRPPRRVRFRVTDRGVGVTSADRDHLFEPFFTGYDTLHHSSGEYQYCKRGIGLGLCLVKTFVELHGGKVDVQSEPGQGSTFSFSLPRRSAPITKATTPIPTPAQAG